MKTRNGSPDEQLSKIGKLLPFAAALAVITSALSLYALRGSHLATFVIITSGALLVLYAFLAVSFLISQKERPVPVRIRKR